jgi:hypothetical protein
VDPNVIPADTDTTLTITAQFYYGDQPVTTTNIHAYWFDSGGTKGSCSSSGSSCQGQSGMLDAHSSSTVSVSASAEGGPFKTCQTFFQNP